MGIYVKVLAGKGVLRLHQSITRCGGITLAEAVYSMTSQRETAQRDLKGNFPKGIFMRNDISLAALGLHDLLLIYHYHSGCSTGNTRSFDCIARRNRGL